MFRKFTGKLYIMGKSQLAQLHQRFQTILSTWEMPQQQPDECHQRFLEQQDAYIGLQQQQHEHEILLQVARESQTCIQEQVGKFGQFVNSKLAHLFSQHAQRENQRVQNLLKQTEAREKLKQDQLYSTVIKTINTAVVSSLEKMVQHEIRQNVLLGVTKSLEPVKEQMHQELTQKLTATNSILKENNAKMDCSQQTIDVTGMAARNALSTPVQVAYKESFQNIMIPSFERATQAMVQQVTDTLQKGTREYIKHLETKLDQVRQKHLEACNPIVSELQQLTDSFQTSAERVQSHVLATIQTELKSELQSSLSGVQEMIVPYVRDAVREEVSMAVKEQGTRIRNIILNAMISGAVTQVTPDPQLAKSQILHLLQQGQLNTAFHQALSAVNLEMVIFVCEKVNVSQVFEQTPCPLHQPVLLSLIQQLSVDLGSNTELKHKFIVEAMVDLDRSDPAIQGHITFVIYGLIQKVNAFMKKHPHHEMNRPFKMLLMAAESLVR